LTRGDLITNTTRYLQVAERLRPDVRIVDQELLGFDWQRDRLLTLHPELSIPTGRYMPGAPDGFSIASLLDANFERSPILMCGGHKPGDETWVTRYVERPMGLCAMVCRVNGPNDSAEADRSASESEVALPRIERPDARGGPDPGRRLRCTIIGLRAPHAPSLSWSSQVGTLLAVGSYRLHPAHLRTSSRTIPVPSLQATGSAPRPSVDSDSTHRSKRPRRARRGARTCVWRAETVAGVR
jgi:hypothetical protein